MAKRIARPNPTPAPARRERESDESMRARNLTPFLRPEHVISGESLKLTGFNAMRDRDTDREQVICEVENEHGHTFSLGVRTGSPDHRILHRTFGESFRQWRGTVTVTIAPGRTRDHAGFVNVKSADTDYPVWDGGAPPHPADSDAGE